MTRTRTIAAAVVVLALLQLATLTKPARADTEGFSRLRVTLSTTSDWARVSFRDIDVRVQETSSLTPGAQHFAQESGWTIVSGGPDGAAAVIDMVVELDEGADPGIVLGKGMTGEAAVQVDTRNRAANETVVSERLVTQDRNHNELQIPVDAATLGIGDLAVGPVDERRLSLAFYYPWFGSDTPSKRSIGPDKPVRPYATDDPESVAAMVRQARGAGVDGFVVSWSGTRHAGSVQLLLDAAAAEPGFAVTPVLELRAFRESALLLGERFSPDAAAQAAREFFRGVPAGSTLEVDGRRVAFMFGMWDLSADEWAAFRSRVADLDLFIVGDRRSSSHPVDGIYDYDPNGLDRAGLEARAERSVNAARLRPQIDAAQSHRLWAATVSPGFDTRYSQPIWEARRTPRDGGARYDLTWQVALDADPDWVLITSWNEWYEQTHVVPGSRTGSRALGQTADWTGRF